VSDRARSSSQSDDQRVRWRNREVSGPYPDERGLPRLVSGVPPTDPSYRAAPEVG